MDKDKYGNHHSNSMVKYPPHIIIYNNKCKIEERYPLIFPKAIEERWLYVPRFHKFTSLSSQVPQRTIKVTKQVRIAIAMTKSVRNKIKIKKIDNLSVRLVTFLKRRRGLLKKAGELSVLYDCEYAVIIFSATENLFAQVVVKDRRPEGPTGFWSVPKILR
ncbi:hypothetical protein ACLB2K_032222 [Fragaria x ananassa]